MARRNRYIVGGCVYEICFRAREGLPLPPNEVINALIKSAIARTQRDHKVVLSHFLWMSNHVHLFIVAKDSEQCRRFYAEVQKRVTDAIKRLLRLDFLRLWEGRPTVALVADVAAAKDRIAYFYANPASADLVDKIEQYPGVSSWSAFRGNWIDSKTTSSEVWIRMPTVPELSRPNISRGEEQRIVKEMKEANSKSYELTVQPNAWMSAFGVSEPEEIFAINADIRAGITAKELKARNERISRGISVVGAERLKRENIMRAHSPKKKERKIFVLCSVKELRMEIIESYNTMREYLRELYKKWRDGDHSIVWPPGVFRPAAPPIANAIA